MTQDLRLRAGAASAPILIDPGVLPLEGFTGVHDDLHVRVLIIDDARIRIVLVALEVTSVFAHTVAELQLLVASCTSAVASNVIICATHTFSAPHILHDDEAAAGADRASALAFTAAVRTATKEAASAAAASVRPALLGVEVGTSAVNACRDVQTPHGWWLGVDEYGPTDRTLTTLHMREPDGNVIAVLFSHAVPSAVMAESTTSGGGRLISADLAGAAATAIEAAHPGAVAFFACGAAGDQVPVYVASRPTLDSQGNPGRLDAREAGFALVDVLGTQLSRDVLELLTSTTCGELKRPLELAHNSITVGGQTSTPFTELRPVHTAPYSPDGTRAVPFVTLTIGDLAFVGTQAELASLTSNELRASSPAAATIVATMVNGAAKYMVDAAGYDKATYGALNSQYQQGAAEAVRDAIITRLNESA